MRRAVAGTPLAMHRKLWIVALPLAACAVLAVLLAALSDANDASASPAAWSAPIAPPRVPVRPPPVLSDAPGEGVEAEEDRLVQLPLPDPDSFAPGAPARAAAEFLDAWHDRAWDRMALWTAPSWRSRFSDPSEELRRRYAAYRLLGWAFRDERLRQLVSEFDVLVTRRGMRPRIERERVRLVAVRETDDGRLIGTGPRRWALLPR